MFFVLGLTVLLVALLVLNNAASLIAVLLWKIFGGRVNRWSAQRSAQALFLLRTLPVALSIGAVVFLFAPAYLRYEPRVGHEDVSAKLALLATLSLIVIAAAIVRGIARWRATDRLTAAWLRMAEPIQIPTVTVPAYQVEHPFPLIAVVGAFRPRLFIARLIFQSLTPAELTAALEHENGHLRAHDNLKRTVACACGDLLLIPVGRGLDRAWLDASEAAADEFAVRRNRRIGLDLASALVKIGRLIPAGARPTMPAVAFLAGEEGTQGFKARVRRLVNLADNQQKQSNVTGLIAQLTKLIPAALALLLVALASKFQVLPAIHAVIERAVYILS
ncbi:MAG: M56 family metallopeptidase [Pyrinomonadaceae bacterium]|nr:M56 family metallopeptidase [Pyrinomonadaceae bacterium]